MRMLKVVRDSKPDIDDIIYDPKGSALRMFNHRNYKPNSRFPVAIYDPLILANHYDQITLFTTEFIKLHEVSIEELIEQLYRRSHGGTGYCRKETDIRSIATVLSKLYNGSIFPLVNQVYGINLYQYGKLFKSMYGSFNLPFIFIKSIDSDSLRGKFVSNNYLEYKEKNFSISELMENFMVKGTTQMIEDSFIWSESKHQYLNYYFTVVLDSLKELFIDPMKQYFPYGEIPLFELLALDRLRMKSKVYTITEKWKDYRKVGGLLPDVPIETINHILTGEYLKFDYISLIKQTIVNDICSCLNEGGSTKTDGNSSNHFSA